jgi:hypothetical protein
MEKLQENKINKVDKNIESMKWTYKEEELQKLTKISLIRKTE